MTLPFGSSDHSILCVSIDAKLKEISDVPCYRIVFRYSKDLSMSKFLSQFQTTSFSKKNIQNRLSLLWVDIFQNWEFRPFRNVLSKTEQSVLVFTYVERWTQHIQVCSKANSSAFDHTIIFITINGVARHIFRTARNNYITILETVYTRYLLLVQARIVNERLDTHKPKHLCLQQLKDLKVISSL